MTSGERELLLIDKFYMERNYVTVSNLSDGEGSRQLILPKGTPFGNWKEARRYAGPLPFTFTYN